MPVLSCSAVAWAMAGVEAMRTLPPVTGYWQVSDRHESEFTKRVDFDEHYDDDVSLVTDIVLIFRTFGAVLRGTGA